MVVVLIALRFAPLCHDLLLKVASYGSLPIFMRSNDISYGVLVYKITAGAE